MSEKHTMNAIEIIAGELVHIQREIPKPQAQQVLIKVHAAGINRPDIMQRKGLYPAPKEASDIPGLEVAGTVTALGSDVTHLKIGDTVCALLTGGGVC